MDAWSGSHEWARRFRGLGHSMRLLAAVFVAPYRKSGKNDGNAAEAICERLGGYNVRDDVREPARESALVKHHCRSRG